VFAGIGRRTDVGVGAERIIRKQPARSPGRRGCWRRAPWTRHSAAGTGSRTPFIPGENDPARFSPSSTTLRMRPWRRRVERSRLSHRGAPSRFPGVLYSGSLAPRRWWRDDQDRWPAHRAWVKAGRPGAAAAVTRPRDPRSSAQPLMQYQNSFRSGSRPSSNRGPGWPPHFEQKHLGADHPRLPGRRPGFTAHFHRTRRRTAVRSSAPVARRELRVTERELSAPAARTRGTAASAFSGSFNSFEPRGRSVPSGLRISATAPAVSSRRTPLRHCSPCRQSGHHPFHKSARQ